MKIGAITRNAGLHDALRRSVRVVGVAAVLLMLSGCDSRPPTRSAPAADTSSAAPAASGAPQAAESLSAGEKAPTRPTADADTQAHVHAAPRGGTLVELGDHEANVELLLDASAGRLTAYLLDAHAENPIRESAAALHCRVTSVRDAAGQRAVDWELALLPIANVLTGETVGSTSEFAAQDDRLRGLHTATGLFDKLHVRGGDYREVSFTVAARNVE